MTLSNYETTLKDYFHAKFDFDPTTKVAWANVCFAAPPIQIGNIVTIIMMVICVKLWTV